MRPSWGLIAALGLLCGMLFTLTAAVKSFLRDAMQSKSHVYSQEQFDQELAKWHLANDQKHSR